MAEVTPDDGLLVIVNHAGNLSSLYISDVVSEYQVKTRFLYSIIHDDYDTGMKMTFTFRFSSRWPFQG